MTNFSRRNFLIALSCGMASISLPAVKATGSPMREPLPSQVPPELAFLERSDIAKIERVAINLQSKADCAINAVKYAGPGKYLQAVTELTANWSISDFLFLQTSGATLLPLFDAFESAGASKQKIQGQFGSAGEFSSLIKRSAKAAEIVWDTVIPWKVRPIKSDVLSDKDRMVYLYQLGYGFSIEKATVLAETVFQYINHPRFDYGQSPYFTANAMAFPASMVITSSGLISDFMTLIGDGMLEIFDKLSLGDVAPGAILTHEHYHHMQQFKQLPSLYSTTTALESAADAGGTYAATHVRGLSFQTKRVTKVWDVFSSMGQVEGDLITHGSAQERMLSSQWGAQRQAEARPRSFRISTTDFDNLFVDWHSHMSTLK